MTTRTFRIARPLARLASAHGSRSRRVEGHFPPGAERASHVVVEGGVAELVVEAGGGAERVEIPRAHADALLDVAAGTAEAERTTLRFGTEASLDRYARPSIDLVHVAFATEAEAKAYSPPAWLGEEVTGRKEYAPSSLAIAGAPTGGEPRASDAALDALLDEIEPLAGRRDGRVEDAVEGLSRILLSEPGQKPVREVIPGGKRAGAA